MEIPMPRGPCNASSVKTRALLVVKTSETDLFDGFALFLWGKPIGLQELLISSSPCPKLSSQKAYCQTSCKSIIKNGLPRPSLFTKWKTICLFLFVCYAIL